MFVSWVKSTANWAQEQRHIGNTHNLYSTGETPLELRLTKNILIVIQQIRALDVQRKPKAYSAIYL